MKKMSATLHSLEIKRKKNVIKVVAIIKLSERKAPIFFLLLSFM
jgi:hypothetical protein